MKYIYTLFLVIILAECKPKTNDFSAQEIINKSIVASGTDKIANSKINFTFRGINYFADRNNGKFKLVRIKDSIKDILKNEGFTRLINDKEVFTPDSLASKYSNSVNSVHYFSVLPFGLNDKAVKKKLLKSASVNGEEYYKVEITFNQDGGGEDFEDVFIYWIGKNDFLVDYLAYSYHTNGGGMRFRALKEDYSTNDIRFVNYYNYKPQNENIELIDIDKAFENNQLKKVSEIILENIEVSLKN